VARDSVRVWVGSASGEGRPALQPKTCFPERFSRNPSHGLPVRPPIWPPIWPPILPPIRPPIRDGSEWERAGFKREIPDLQISYLDSQKRAARIFNFCKSNE